VAADKTVVSPRREPAGPATVEPPKRRGLLIAGIAGVAVLAIAAVFAMKGRGQPEVLPALVEPSAAPVAAIELPASAPVAPVVEPGAVATLPAAIDAAASAPGGSQQAEVNAAVAPAKRRPDPKAATSPAEQAVQPAATTAPAAAAPAPADLAAGPKTPGEACGARKFLARLTCILRECESNPAFHDHPHCVRARELEDERKRKELNGG
jgi:hypothetical protein